MKMPFYAVILLCVIPACVSYKPRFVGQVQNVTSQKGQDTSLSCTVQNLGAYKVAWVRVETQTILTIHRTVITRNPRISLEGEGERSWRLNINNVSEEDRGFYMCQINTDPMISQLGHLEVVVPPSIVDSGSSSDLVVREGVDIELRCKATGHPAPTVQWRREDDTFISRASGINSDALSISRVSRLHMGAYLCIARNGVPPAVSKKVQLHVHFAPVVLVSSQLESGFVGQSAKELECKTEAFPPSINYWTNSQNELITPDEKYEIATDDTALYRRTMRLRIRLLQRADFQRYTCVAKNSIGEVDGHITLDEATPATSISTEQRKFSHVTKSYKDWGGTTKHLQKQRTNSELQDLRPKSSDLYQVEDEEKADSHRESASGAAALIRSRLSTCTVLLVHTLLIALLFCCG